MENYVETDTSAKKEYECPSCGSIYTVQWEPDEVDTAFSGVGPELCPFCGDD